MFVFQFMTFVILSKTKDLAESLAKSLREILHYVQNDMIVFYFTFFKAISYASR